MFFENAAMDGEGKSRSSIFAFFVTGEGRQLFTKCPFRPYLTDIDDLDSGASQAVFAHLLGHILDYRAGAPSVADSGSATREISQRDIEDQLRYIYNDLNNDAINAARRDNPDVRSTDRVEYNGFGPEQRGCFGSDARAELMAEAFRAYLQDPNYIKTVAPQVATRIRQAVNANPELNQVIQFN